jgi:hypothetical protein
MIYRTYMHVLECGHLKMTWCCTELTADVLDISSMWATGYRLSDYTEIQHGYLDHALSFFIYYFISNTRVQISHLVTSLPTSRQQVVFALLVPSCQQVWNKLLTICNNLVDIIRFVARLFQQVRYCHDIGVLLQPCNILVHHDCIRLVRTTLWQVW